MLARFVFCKYVHPQTEGYHDRTNNYQNQTYVCKFILLHGHQGANYEKYSPSRFKILLLIHPASIFLLLQKSSFQHSDRL